MAISKELLRKLQAEAKDLGVAVALPQYTLRVETRSQSHIMYAASHALLMLRHERGDHDV